MASAKDEVRWVYQQFYLGGNSYKMYHGTSVDNAKKIADKGFKVGKGRGRFKRDGMLGFGVYASPDINKAREYAKPRYTDGKPGVVLELEVDMGPMIYRVTEQKQGLKKTWQDHGYDSAYVPPGCGMVPSNMTEVCVKEPSNVRVRCLASFGDCNCTVEEYDEVSSRIARNRGQAVCLVPSQITHVPMQFVVFQHPAGGPAVAVPVAPPTLYFN